MKRSARCIQMLQLLKARGFLSREELATLLDTNIRNVSEYRKELEEAGYSIISTTGKYGGYQLDASCLFPIVGLRQEEVKAVSEAISYMKSHDDFLLLPQFLSAMDKLMATLTMEKKEGGIYVKGNTPLLNPMLKEFIMRMDGARNDQLAVDIVYKGMHAKNFEKVSIHPYEILNDAGSYYCLAYSLKAKDYRNFKFSEERMKQVQVSDVKFQRDADFQVSEHIGKKGLIRNEVYELDVLIHGESALLVSEKMIGIDPKGEWIDEHVLHFTTIMEGKIPTMQFLLSLGNQVEVRKPLSLKAELKHIVEDMFRQYHETKVPTYDIIQDRESVEK